MEVQRSIEPPGGDGLVLGRGARVLLAEDNPVNRKVASRLLEKRGFVVIAVEDGKQAVDALGRERFDIILMDVQMPVMDGLTATRTIREHERTTGSHMPIVAVTAHAMKGDRERCLEAGMDAYVTKPIDASALLAAMEHLLPQREREEIDMTAPGTTGFDEVLDRESLLERVESDAELLAALIELYESDSPQMVEELRAQVAAGDAAALHRTAHKLKGSLLTLSATEASQVALRLESMGRDGNLAQAADVLAALESELVKVTQALSALQASLK